MVTNNPKPAHECCNRHLNMEKFFQSVEEVLTDELFQAWYFKTDAQKAADWEQWLKQHPSQQQLANEAVACMQSIVIREHEIPATQVEASGQRLMNSLSNASTPGIET